MCDAERSDGAVETAEPMGLEALARIYPPAFFARWGRANAAYVASARVIADELQRQLAPRRLVDVGCGCGVYAERFARLGVEVVAIDGVRAPAAAGFGVEVAIRDLTAPLVDEWGRFDLALCLDVGEHIPKELCDVFLDNLCGLADTLVLSCAPPGQGGDHHVNEQPKRWWIARLAEHGFAYQRPATGRLCERFKRLRPPLMWMWEQISVYRRAD